MNSVPASYFSSVNPAVLAAGGNGLDLIGLFLTTSTRTPIGTVPSFSSALSVGNYFGTSSAEYAAAVTYFNGFLNSNIKPGALLFAQYNTAAVAGYLRGGNVGASLTLTQLQAITADKLTITTAGVPLQATSNIVLSGATSFSNAATIIQAAFTTPPFTVSYDSIAGAFVFTNTATGSTSTQAFATSTGTMAAALMLTQATGAVLSQGAAAATPAAFMASIIAITTNWASFCTLFNPDVSGNANKLLFAQWNAAQKDQFVYVCWDNDITATNTVPATASLGYLLAQANSDGTCLVYDPSNLGTAPFVCGLLASIDFTETEGNVNPTYKGGSNLAPVVTDQTILANLQANGYNCIVASATANQSFTFLWNGQISGQWKWLQPFINQIWLNSSFQLSAMLLLTSAKSIPYNPTGDGMIRTAYMDPINAALNFGAIQSNVQLSSTQAAEVNAAAGMQIDQTLSTRGWYLQILAASPTVRQNRGTPPCTFWYTDGGSVQQLNLASVDLL